MKQRGRVALAAVRQALQRAEREASPRAPDRCERPEPTAQDLFARSVGPVQPVRDRHLAEIELPRPPAQPRQREADERAALRESQSDEVDVESLLLTDDGLGFRRAGIGPDVVARLRRGHWALQGQIDLHGLTRDEARTALAGYLRDARRRGQRCLRVVHGKGHGSPLRQPVLKSRVQRWLAQNDAVIAFTQARAAQGGAGALIVLLAG